MSGEKDRQNNTRSKQKYAKDKMMLVLFVAIANKTTSSKIQSVKMGALDQRRKNIFVVLYGYLMLYSRQVVVMITNTPTETQTTKAVCLCVSYLIQ